MTFSPTCSPGSRSKLQSAARGHHLLVERAAVGDGVVDRGVDGAATTAPAISSRRHAQLRRRQRDAVEAGERVAHGVVAAGAHVVDERGDRRPQLGVEDVVETAGAQRARARLVHLRPAHPAHHCIDRTTGIAVERRCSAHEHSP